MQYDPISQGSKGILFSGGEAFLFHTLSAPSKRKSKMKISRSFWVALVCYVGICAVSTNYVDAACGGALTQDRGVITSPSFPSPYPGNSDCRWTIEAPEKVNFTINFTHFDLKEPRVGCYSGDYVSVWSKVNPEEKDMVRLGLFCGNSLPGPIYFEGSQIQINFVSKSGNINQHSGFSLRYSLTVPAPPTLPPTTTTPTTPIQSSPRKALNDEVVLAREKLRHWFLGLRKEGASKWGHQLPRTAVALFLADRGSFQSGNRSMDEMNYELTIQLLSKMLGGGPLKRRDLSLYIHALMVTCADPRNFHGRDLVAELRADVESSNGTDVGPLELLVLCNAGDTMTSRDVGRIAAIFDSQHRPFWTDNQALATLALACVSAQPGTSVDERTLLDMAQELKKRQFRNGTVDNHKTTALVLQALMATRSLERDFDFFSAVRSLVSAQKEDGSVGSVLDSYYVLPVLSNVTLLDVRAEHCKKPDISESEALNELQSSRGRRVSVQYSVVIGTDEDLKRIWTLKVPANSSLYDVIETVQKLDSRQRVEYNVIEGKPFVSSAMGVQDDAELGLYWFTYARRRGSEDAVLLEDSPVDVKIEANQELVLWYKTGQWNKPVSS